MPDVKKSVTVADKKNQSDLKRLENGGKATLLAARRLVLIGNGHAREAVDLAKENNAYKATVEIEKGGIKDSGTLTVTGFPGANRREFEDAIKAISKKKVKFA